MFKEYENEIERTYRVRPAEQAAIQNLINIHAWEVGNRISHKEAQILRIENKRLYNENRN